MHPFKIIVLVLLLTTCSSNSKKRQTLTVAFASCNDQNLDTLQIWTSVLAANPDYFIWTGDIIYPSEETPGGLKSGYKVQKSYTEYQKLSESAGILGIFDDHDYAQNDGGANNPYREEAKDLLLEFLDEPKNSKRRDREGVYDSYDMAGGLVKTILLDTRSFRSDLIPSDKPNMRYQPTDKGTILGDTQWKWLENELDDQTSQIVILVTSIQFLNDFHGFEKWGNFTEERKRLIDLLNNSRKKVIVISGDRHYAEVSQLNEKLLEVTSSGMTHTYKGVKENNPLRVSPLIDDRNFGVLKISYNMESAQVDAIELIGDKSRVLWRSTVAPDLL